MADNVIGKTLGRLGNRMDVHAVRTGAQNASQASGAEGQVLIKSVLQFLRAFSKCLELRG